MEKILELFKAYEKLIQHRGYMGQQVNCCGAHMLLSDAYGELVALTTAKEQSAIPQQLKDAIALMLRYANRCFEGAEYDKFIECLRVVEQRASV